MLFALFKAQQEHMFLFLVKIFGSTEINVTDDDCEF